MVLWAQYIALPIISNRLKVLLKAESNIHRLKIKIDMGLLVEHKQVESVCLRPCRLRASEPPHLGLYTTINQQE